MNWRHIFSIHRLRFAKYYTKSSLYIICIILLFISIGFLTTVKPAYRFSSQMITNWTNNIDSSAFVLLLGMENRTFHQALPQKQTIPHISTVLFQLMTNIKPNDPRSFLGRELPGLQTYQHEFIIASEGIDYTNLSFESSPPIDDVLKDREAIYENDDEFENEKEQSKQDSPSDQDVVFIYNTHNRESFLPHLPGVNDPNSAHHDDVNITKVSDRFAKSLEKEGIGVFVDDTDHIQELKKEGKDYGESYQSSREVIKNVLTTKEDIEYVFDIHRDALPREKTTIDIQGESYAQLLIIVGSEHETYEENLAFATELHQLIEEKYPGLSKGVIKKEGSGSNGVYNQDMQEKALLFEIGGYENKLEELYRTVDLFAEIFSEYYWEAEKVHANE